MPLKTKELVRVRMAPSPTGPFHIGSARTALFNYLFAKKEGGKFILRIEDTDRERSKPEWEDNIKESFSWIGFDYDEGPDRDGGYGPYRQSERRSIYKGYIKKLLDENSAYHCFCANEAAESQKQYSLRQGQAPIYSGKCRQLSDHEVAERISRGQSSVIRLKVPNKNVSFEDLLRGKIEYNSATFGDFVIAKDIETPLYNLACVIDDFEMRITHVIRGEEHISNTPRQILIAEALGIQTPLYLHLPLILNQNRAKLSKRDPQIAAKVLDYKENGYLPEALINFIAFLGWNPGTNQEVFSLAELIQGFSVAKLQKSGAIFNVQKLDWLNGFYIRHAELNKVTDLCLPYLISRGLIKPVLEGYAKDPMVIEYEIITTKEKINFQAIAAIVALYHKRLKKISEISDLIDFFFLKKLNYDSDLLKWKDMKTEELLGVFNNVLGGLESIKEGDWKKEELERVTASKVEELGDRGKLLWPLRVALSGKGASCGPIEIAMALGKEKTIQRIREAIEKLSLRED